MNNELKALDKFTEWIIFVVIGFVLGLLASNTVAPYLETQPREQKVIDSLSNKNESIKVKVDSLETIKNAKVIEVSTLDDDSTVKLFYKLVKE